MISTLVEEPWKTCERNVMAHEHILNPNLWCRETSSHVGRWKEAKGSGRSCKRGVLRNLHSAQSFFFTTESRARNAKVLQRVVKQEESFTAERLYHFQLLKAYRLTKLFYPASGRVPLICVHRCRHLDLSWRWHVQPVENKKVCCGFGNVFLGPRKLLLPTSRAARGGGGSFKKKKPIGNIRCCESQMSDQKHWVLVQLSNSLTD